MDGVKRSLGPLVAWLATAAFASARIGDTPTALAQRYGRPIKESFDKNGNGVAFYRTDEFKRIWVTFAHGKSQEEEFWAGPDRTIPEALATRVRAENSDQPFYAGGAKMGVGRSETHLSLKFALFTGFTRTFTGTVELAEEGRYEGNRSRFLIVRERDVVIEIPLLFPIPLDETKPGDQCSVTVLDEYEQDTSTPIAVIGQRTHLNWGDCVTDPRSSLQILVRISANGKVLFDRSVCEVHQLPMQLRKVDVVYGLFSSSYCDENFPHHRGMARGGCVDLGKKEQTRIFVCSACVKACEGYTRDHPELN